MSKTFINEHSAKCLLGPMSKEAKFNGSLFTWKVMKKDHFCIVNELREADIDFLKEYIQDKGVLSFHYISDDQLIELKKHFDLERVKLKSSITAVDGSSFDFVGRKLRRLRNYMNRYQDLEICDNYKNIQDVKDMIEDWSNTSAEKYFRDFSGKNFFFFKNNFHATSNSVFVYDKDRLVSFGVATPVEDGMCSYTVGKALCLEYHGLSEFTDIKLYEKVWNINKEPFEINLGQAKGKLLTYKAKFPNTRFEVHYDGKIKIQ